MIECIDPTPPGLFRSNGEEIEVPASAGLFRCPTCQRKTDAANKQRYEKDNGKKMKGLARRNTVFFRAFLAVGSVIEVKCHRCGDSIRYRSGAE